MSRSNYNRGEKRERCYFCPATHGLEEHHIVPKRFGGGDGTVNIVTVCEKCHNKLERLYDKRFYEHFGIDDEKGERRKHRICNFKRCKEYADETVHVAGVNRTATLEFCEEHAERHQP